MGTSKTNPKLVYSKFSNGYFFFFPHLFLFVCLFVCVYGTKASVERQTYNQHLNWSGIVQSSRPVAGRWGNAPPKSAKRSTFSHKMGQKWGLCRRVKGGEVQKVHFLGPSGPFFGGPAPPIINPGYGPAILHQNCGDLTYTLPIGLCIPGA